MPSEPAGSQLCRSVSLAWNAANFARASASLLPPQDPIAWPLATSLDGFGETVKNAPSQTRCGVVSGEDLTTLLAAANEANALTPWTSGGTEYHLIFRPLLPDEHTC